MNATLLVLAGLAGLFFPLGVALRAGDAERGGQEAGGRAAGYVLTAVVLGVVGYVAVGFALSFGGSAGLYPALSELAALNKTWTPLLAWQGPGWSMAGATGFFLTVGDDPGAYALFFFHATALAAVMAAFAAGFARWLRPQPFTLLVVLFGWAVLPLVMAWVWGGGWLATLGATRELGHGFVDAGGGALLVALGSVGMAGVVARQWPVRKAPPSQSDSEGDGRAAEPMSGSAGQVRDNATVPSVDPSGSAMAGTAALLVGWLGLLAGWAIISGTSLPLVLSNALAGAAAGATMALAYMGFTSARLDSLMGARGLAAGIVAAGVSGPFVSTPAAFLIGAVAGLVVCWTSYLATQWNMDDAADGVAVLGVGGVWGLMALGLFADGRSGQGWHGAGLGEYMGVAGQGVTGLLPAAGFVADPPQLAAQLLGIASIGIWAFVPTLLLLVLSGGRAAIVEPSR